MAWQEPKTDWKPSDALGAEDMNRIEGNTAELKNMANQTNENIGGIIADLGKIGLRGQTGITRVDQTGVEVQHIDINAKTVMSADGFKILDNNGNQIGGLMVIDGKIRNISSVLSNPDMPDFYAVAGDVVGGVPFPSVSFYHTVNGQTKPFLQFASSGAVGNTGWLEFYARYGRRKDQLTLFNDWTRLYHFVDDEFIGAIEIHWYSFIPSIVIRRSDYERTYRVWHTGDLLTLEGEVSTSGSITFNYPDGFNKDNTLVIAVKVDRGSVIRNVVPSEIEYNESDIYMMSSYFEAGNKVQIAIIKV